jgi:hypothetical protein
MEEPKKVAAALLPYASLHLRCSIFFAGVNAIELAAGTPPEKIKSLLVDLASRNLAHVLRTASMHIDDLKAACDPQADPKLQRQAVKLLRQLWEEPLHLTQCFANLSAENQKALAGLIRDAGPRVFKGEERSEFATYFAFHSNISLEDKASLLCSVYPQARAILADDILDHWRGMSAPTFHYIIDALGKGLISGPELGLKCARVRAAGPAEVAALIDRYLPKSKEPKLREVWGREQEVSPADYSEADHQRAAGIINDHLVGQRSAILEQLGLANPQLCNAVEPFVEYITKQQVRA